MLDEASGTEVVGTLPSRIRFTSGQDQLACITLSARGPYRWYAQCCRMAIGNGSRSPQVPFVTVQCRALAVPRAELDRAFGPSSFAFAVQAATKKVASTPVGFALTLPKVLWTILAARVSGAWRTNPFFRDGTSEPIRAPQALSQQQRYALRGDAPPRNRA
jgi:hypothetical protein